MKRATFLFLAALVLAGASTARAGDSDDWCRDYEDSRHGWHCEIREMTLTARETIAVDAAPNGGIDVEGWDGGEIRLVAKVASRADSDEEAREIVSRVTIETDGKIEADGPRLRRGDEWWVSYRLQVPRSSNLELESTNGGISVAEVRGTISARTTNGGLHFDGVGGDVRGRTTNGGAKVQLTGDSWQGEGLDVKTTNGGVSLVVPEGYNARLETGTVNGGTRFDFPVMVTGDLGKRVELDLGNGGPTVRVSTTNGGVRVRRP